MRFGNWPRRLRGRRERPTCQTRGQCACWCPAPAPAASARRGDRSPRAPAAWLTEQLRSIICRTSSKRRADVDRTFLWPFIQLVYPNTLGSLQGVESGILLQVGFEDTVPNRPVTISSWSSPMCSISSARPPARRAGGSGCARPMNTSSHAPPAFLLGDSTWRCVFAAEYMRTAARSKVQRRFHRESCSQARQSFSESRRRAGVRHRDRKLCALRAGVASRSRADGGLRRIGARLAGRRQQRVGAGRGV